MRCCSVFARLVEGYEGVDHARDDTYQRIEVVDMLDGRESATGQCRPQHFGIRVSREDMINYYEHSLPIGLKY